MPPNNNAANGVVAPKAAVMIQVIGKLPESYPQSFDPVNAIDYVLHNLRPLTLNHMLTDITRQILRQEWSRLLMRRDSIMKGRV